MMTNAQFLLVMLTGFVVFCGLAFVTVYKFKDCKKVGHSTLYCILDL